MPVPERRTDAAPPAVRTPALRAAACSYRTAGIDILHHLTFTLYPGEMCGLLGPSGAGKSTLMKLALGFLRPTEGDIGRADNDAPIGYVPQDDALHRVLRVQDALRFSAALRLRDTPDDERLRRVDEVMKQVGLFERRDVRIARLSGGQRKRVSVAIELLTTPSVLILDEPTSGLDPGLEKRMMELFLGLSAQGKSVLVATHAMQSLSLCQAVLILMKGRLVFFGAPPTALEYFSTARFGGIFDALTQKTAQQWQRRFAESSIRRAFDARPPPPIPAVAATSVASAARPPQGAPAAGANVAASPAAKTEREAAPVDDPDAALAALKSKMGLT